MKYLALVIFSLLILTSCGGSQPSADATDASAAVQADVMAAADPEYYVDYDRVDDILADISEQMHQPNILKDDILRGWYQASEAEKKYGTPDTWIFVEDGSNSRWMSPNLIDEGDLIDERQLCRQTAGSYTASCLESSDEDCEFVNESHCQCISGTAWKDAQGCIMVTEKGGFVSINNTEMAQGWYYGLPNQKKLNTPNTWTWTENSKQSMWHK